MSSPADFEVNIFGPGFGESIAAHVGCGRWIIIDSCIDRTTKQPAAIQFLSSIGVNIETQVILIVITHWHDDHIRGMSQLVKGCRNAAVCISPALQDRQFREFVGSYGAAGGSATTSGVTELKLIMETMRDARKPFTFSLPSRRVLSLEAVEGKCAGVEVWTLSPSDTQFQNALARIGLQTPKYAQAKCRVPGAGQNDLSIAVWLRVGDHACLFGADLEETGNPAFGWSAVLNDNTRPKGKAIIFKIPHHGSRNGHHEAVWSDMLGAEPMSVLTPWNRNKGLPTPGDVQRIISKTSRAYSTSRSKPGPLRRVRSSAVERTIREVVGKSLTAAQAPMGRVRINVDGDGNCSVDLFDFACDLESFGQVTS